LAFISGIDPLVDGSGAQYVPMTVTMFVETSTRERTAPITRTVRVYPNRLCQYEY
jgi:hypothetical protein